MEKVIKVNPIQSAPFDSNNNLIDFIVPDAQYDFTKSFINAEVEVTIVDADPTTGAGVYNWEIYNLHGNHYKNSALIKNARMTSDKGLIEDIRRSDILSQHLANVSESFEDRQAHELGDLFVPRGEGNQKFAPGLEVYKLGTKSSFQRTVNVQIPLKDVFATGRLKQMPCDKLGDVRMHLETDLSLLDPLVSSPKPANPGNPSGIEKQQADLDFGKEQFRQFANVTAPSANYAVTSLITASQFPDMADSPFYVGRKLHLIFTNNNVAADKDAVITSIVKNADQTLTLNFNGTIATITTTGDKLEQIVCYQAGVASLTTVVAKAELTLVRIPSQPVGDLEYITFEHEADNGSGLQHFERQYILPENCMNVMVVPTDSADKVSRHGPNGQYALDKYRLRLEGQGDLTDRDVKYETPLYHNQVGNCLLRALREYKNATRRMLDVNETNDNKLSGGEVISFIGAPVPVTSTTKKLQVNIDCTASHQVNNLHIFKQVVKKINL